MTTPIQIRKDEVVRDIRELAALTRRPITDAVAAAVRAALERARRDDTKDARRLAVREAVRRFQDAPLVGPVLTDDDLYDDGPASVIAVDASAVLAILFQEADAKVFEDALMRAGGGLISPVNHWEILVRAQTARGEAGRAAAKALIQALGLEVATIGARDSIQAVEAFDGFGKRAAGGLNLGDCFAYALAANEGDGLLFKGGDFPRTDVICAMPGQPPGMQEA